MKNTFHGHFRPSEEHFTMLWKDAMFCLDTNILLRLYRYSEVTKNELLNALTSVRDQVWLIHRVGEEYFKHRLPELGRQLNTYKTSKENFRTILDILHDEKNHPVISGNLYDNLQALYSRIEDEFNVNEKKIEERLNNDDILQKLEEIIGNKVSSSYSPAELEAIKKEGDERFSVDIPPGFVDAKKKQDPNDKLSKYGDLIIWKQMIDLSIKEKKPIIFITEDRKEDWWLKQSGRTIGPIPALIYEFKQKSGFDFYMYSADRFLLNSAKSGKQEVNKDVLLELRAARTYDDQHVGLQGKQLSEIFQLNPHFEVHVATNGEFRYQFVLGNVVVLNGVETYHSIDAMIRGIIILKAAFRIDSNLVVRTVLNVFEFGIEANGYLQCVSEMYDTQDELYQHYEEIKLFVSEASPYPINEWK